jgi:hypothetical protein
MPKKRAKKYSDSSEDEISDRQWKVAQLAATLATRYPLTIKNEANKSWRTIAKQHELTADDRRLYISLVDHAEMILSAASKKVGFINAGAFFGSYDFYSANKIAITLKEAKWPDLQSEASIKKFMEEYFERCEIRHKAMLKNLGSEIGSSMEEFMSEEEFISEHNKSAVDQFEEEYAQIKERKRVQENRTTYAAREIFEDAINFWALKDSVEKRKFEISKDYLSLVLDSGF